ncbi:MAG: damage-control phosphatase, subfamily [Petroclostridium sp.]|jgi:hypothetical protein|uniref:damage-control phosphatase ARMT1 family protein n=1 Tax=Petroclostridium xylanilyticum TaxID=1792311 RepID=UPI000B98326E|nr:ARMT1-like domain-containing protein [Petroclostridium xylanilyticum]MBZ4645676.1 hypothetical protein [Clostridia bacterium]MDK2809753.1 damage-control phosphatase, subfamily [Petroclostridium sp.]
MKVEIECVPCYLKQVISTLKAANYPKEKYNEVINQVIKIIPTLDINASPAENSSIVLLEAYKAMDMEDPFRQAKEESNRLAFSLYDKVEGIINNSTDPLLTAFKVAVAGNVIDMGIMPDFDIHAALREITDKEFDLCDYDDFKQKLATCKKILILGDNSGEIVFDKLLVLQLKKYAQEIIYAVKGGPILNDSTMIDAVEVGMIELAKVITNGSNFMGVYIDRCSKEFLDQFEEADIVISKGQANFESLEGSSLAGDKTFFVLRAKCDLVGACAGAKLGNTLFIRNKVR